MKGTLPSVVWAGHHPFNSVHHQVRQRAPCMRTSLCICTQCMPPSACLPVSPCSRVAHRVAARCAHADSTLGGAWCKSGVKQRNGMVGQTFAQTTKLFVEAAACRCNAMGVCLAGRRPIPSSWADVAPAASRALQRSARASFWRQTRPDATLSSNLSSLVA